MRRLGKIVAVLVALVSIAPLFSCNTGSSEDAAFTTTFTITYDANGGIISAETPTQVLLENVAAELRTSLDLHLTRKGYTFSGWSHTANATTADFSDGEKVLVKSNITLYAVWKENKYIITFNANGGTIKTGTQAISNSSVSLKKAEELGLTRLGYTFTGWAESRDATEVAYTDGQEVTFARNISLYALWKENARYTVTFKENEGTIETTSQTIIEKVPTNLKTAVQLGLSREGYIFKGWAWKSDATVPDFSDGESVTISEDVIVYAVWAKTVTYTVTFNANGGTIKNTVQRLTGETVSGSISGTLQTASALGLSRTGYEFKGWATDKSSSSIAYANGKKITLSDNTTLYALWDKIISYTVTFNANGGSISVSNQKITGTESAGVSGSLQKASALGLSRTGYIFMGWATSSYASSALYSDGASITLKGNVTFYAVWNLPRYNVHFIQTTTWTWGASSKYQEVTGYGTTITLPTASSLGLGRTGYIFLGWKTSSSATTYYKVGSSISITKNTTFYGVWKEDCFYIRWKHPGYTNASGAKYGTLNVTLGKASKTYDSSLRNSSFSSGYIKYSGHGSYAWAAAYIYKKTGYKETTKTVSGYNTFDTDGKYTINISSGTITKDN